MAITLVGTAEASNINGNDATLTLPSGMAQNDVVVVVGGHGHSGNAAGVTTSGYTELLDTGGGQCKLSVSWKRMGASPDTTALCQGSGDSDDATCYVALVFRGVSTTSAIDASLTSTTGTGSPNSPSITTVTNGAIVISCFVQAVDDYTVLAPTGYSVQKDVARNDTSPITAGAAYKAIMPAGAENPGPWTASSSDNYVAATMALTPETPGVFSDSALSVTGGDTTSFVGSVGPSGFLTVTGGGNTAIWVGQALGIVGALGATGTATVSFEGEGGGLGSFSMSPTVTISWVGGKEYMSSVREVIESRGAATVNVA
jgi:hypothetical protein